MNSPNISSLESRICSDRDPPAFLQEGLPLVLSDSGRSFDQVFKRCAEDLRTISFSSLEQIPKDVKYLALRNLDLISLKNLGAVNRFWNQFVKSFIKDKVQLPLKNHPAFYDQLNDYLRNFHKSFSDLIRIDVKNVIYRPTFDQLIKMPFHALICHLQKFPKALDTIYKTKQFVSKTFRPASEKFFGLTFDDLNSFEAVIKKADEFSEWFDRNQEAVKARDMLVIWEVLSECEIDASSSDEEEDVDDLSEEEGDYVDCLDLDCPTLNDLKSVDEVMKQALQFPSWVHENIESLELITKLMLIKFQLSSLPKEIGKLRNLKNLCLCSNELSSLPKEIGQLSNLEELNIHTNQLSSLPDEISALTNLREFDLQQNQIRSLPNGISCLTQLSSLNLSRNQLTFLPEGLSALTVLRRLVISNNRLVSLPEGIGALTNLKGLYLTNNRLSFLPESFVKLTQLVELNCDENQLRCVTQICSLVMLKRLSIQCNQLSDLALQTNALSCLKMLDLGNNQFSEDPHGINELITPLTNQFRHLPEEILHYTSLTELNLNCNHLTSLPGAMSVLKNLCFLSVMGNKLSLFPDSMSTLTKLVKLNLAYNQFRSFPNGIPIQCCILNLKGNHLTSLPAAFGGYTKLAELNVGNNKFTSIPKVIFLLTQLRELHFNDNQLDSLPDEVANLHSLYHFDLGENLLSRLPVSFTALTNLVRLNLSHNRLTSLPNDMSKLVKLHEFFVQNNQLSSIPDGSYNHPHRNRWDVKYRCENNPIICDY